MNMVGLGFGVYRSVVGRSFSVLEFQSLTLWECDVCMWAACYLHGLNRSSARWML